MEELGKASRGKALRRLSLRNSYHALDLSVSQWAEQSVVMKFRRPANNSRILWPMNVWFPRFKPATNLFYLPLA